MVTCPYCAHSTEKGSRVCKKCGRALVQRCLACAEDIPVLSSICPLCGTAQNVPYASPPPPAPFPAPVPQPTWAPLGEQRNIVLTLLLSFITCGIYSLYVRYELGSELNAHARRSLLSPGLDIFLGIITCGLWFIYVDYHYAQELKNICEEERSPVQDVSLLCLLLTLFGLGWVSVLILQNEANQHWRRHQPA
jgi:hypothetical protein